jgi:hypothetical protein
VWVVFARRYREAKYGAEKDKPLPQRTQGITG